MECSQPWVEVSRQGKRCIVYGTFDLFHEGHKKLLQRARALGSHLTVAVSTESYDLTQGKLNIRQSLMHRMQAVQNSGFADEIITEEYAGQQAHDIQRLNIDTLVTGSDWTGRLDYLRKYCEVIYLDRTAGISSTQLRGEVLVGVVGCGRIAKTFVHEVKYVSGIQVKAVFSRSGLGTKAFAEEHHVPYAMGTFEELLAIVDAVYIASPHLTHVPYAMAALSAGKHVLCEKPLCFTRSEAEELYALASAKGLVLLEGINTAYSPCFQRIVAAAESGKIGEISSVSATCTILKQQTGREYDTAQAGGSITELASYPLLAITKILGVGEMEFVGAKSIVNAKTGVDIFSRIDIPFEDAIATGTVGIGAKAEGDLVIAGTQGYIYVPAPWWIANSFEIRFEDPAQCQGFQVEGKGGALRYEIAEFAKLISGDRKESCNLTAKDSLTIAEYMERVRCNNLRRG